jgi:hypothetical protein
MLLNPLVKAPQSGLMHPPTAALNEHSSFNPAIRVPECDWNPVRDVVLLEFAFRALNQFSLLCQLQSPRQPTDYFSLLINSCRLTIAKPEAISLIPYGITSISR